MTSAPLPPDIAAFDDAQRRAIAMLGDITRRLEAGMSERDVYELAETRLGEHGFEGWYHPPEVAINRGGPSRWPFPSSRRKLAPGHLISIDIGPAGGEAYGDAGTTVHFGGGEEPAVLAQARECVRGCCGYASRWKTCGEIYIFAAAWAVNNRMALGNKRAVGHRILPRAGVLATGFPLSAHAAVLLPKNRLHRLNPVRMDGMFAIRPEIVLGDVSASFEEMIYIHEDVRIVLGRDSLRQIGEI